MPSMFITKNYSSKLMIMSFWATVLKSPTKNSIPKISMDTSLHKKGLVSIKK